MLKITEIEPGILQLHAGYLKTFLMVMGFVILSMIVALLLGYEHLSIKVNRSENILLVHKLSLFNGSQSQEIKLSEVQEMRPNISFREVLRGASSMLATITYERPSLKMKDGTEVFLLEKDRSVLYSSKLFRNFNRFLKQSQNNTFSGRTIYMGIFSTFTLIALGFTLLVMLVFVFFVRDVKITLDKKTDSYKVAYLSPTYKNREGSLSEIQNVYILSTVSQSFNQKQAGLYLGLKNKEAILLKSLKVYKQEQVTQELLAPYQANGRKVAAFLAVEFVIF